MSMAYLMRGISNLSQKFQLYNNLKYLIVVSLLVAIVYGTYKFRGDAWESVNKRDGGESSVRRGKRDSVWINKNQTNVLYGTGGATYIRWGRTKCPSGADTVYAGVAGGSLYTTHGGGSNHLCLPMDPIWGTYTAGAKPSGIYGVEYENPTGFKLDNNRGQTLHDNNVPCSVCMSQTKSSVIMIPARNQCYDGWIEEYNGYLMSGHFGHAGRTQFICMDEIPESDQAGYLNEVGELLYNVGGVCGSLPCPPYIPNRELTCVVCTK